MLGSVVNAVCAPVRIVVGRAGREAFGLVLRPSTQERASASVATWPANRNEVGRIGGMKRGKTPNRRPASGCKISAVYNGRGRPASCVLLADVFMPQLRPRANELAHHRDARLVVENLERHTSRPEVVFGATKG